MVYLENDHTYNIELLIDLYHNSKDDDLVSQLDFYLETIKNNNKELDWQEYNLSRENAYNKLKDFKNETIKKAIKH